MSEQTVEQQPAEEQKQQQPQEGEGKEQQETKTFDADYVEKLRKENAKYRTEAKSNAEAAKRLAEIEDAQKSETEKAQERITTAERRAQEAETALARFQVALDKGLTPNQAKRLVGSTREELEADAEELLKDLGEANKPRSPRPDPTQGKQSTQPLDPRSADLAQIEADLAASRRR